MNSKLMHLLGTELHGVFETSYLLEDIRSKKNQRSKEASKQLTA